MLVLFAGCGKDDGGADNFARLEAETVSNYATTARIETGGAAGLTFKAVIVSQSTADWFSFAADKKIAETSGAVGSGAVIYFEANTSSESDNTAKIVVTFSDNYTVVLDLTQARFYYQGWGEQPDYRASANYVYKTYYTTLSSGQYVRNFSICYDKSKRVANWVAYPLHTSYVTPSMTRVDNWGYDPNDQLPVIPQSDQQYIIESYGSGYARGHQCPSADRYSTRATNTMTFYSTNMMPQNYDFNGEIWATLEGKNRSNMLGLKDTLYVVTGTYFGDSKTITDRRGNKIGVPSNCWKVLLRSRSGNLRKPVQECSADELMGIGFWFKNDASNTNNLASYAMTIAEIEQKTGFKFFRNLSPDVATSVKAQKNPSDWNIF